MKKKSLFLLPIFLMLTGCVVANTNSSSSSLNNSNSSIATGESPVGTQLPQTTPTYIPPLPTKTGVSSYTVPTITSAPIVTTNTLSDSFITTDVIDGYTYSEGVYTITKEGEYICKGDLSEGRIIVDAPSAKVTISLDGVNISSSLNSVIFVNDADKVDISAKKDSINYITDKRALETEEVTDETIGSAAIYSNSDLDIQGKGQLIVSGGYNNGIHSKNDLNIKNLTLSVTAPNNALKGNDSLTVESGNLTIISTAGDGLKTTNSDISDKGNQRGNIDILGGTLNIYSLCDGIDAAYNVNISSTNSEPTINIYTSEYSSFSGDITPEASSSIYLRCSSSYYSSSYRFALYYYNDDVNSGVWKNASYHSSSSSSGRPGSSSTNYYFTVDMPSGYTNFMVYRFLSTQEENSLTEYDSKTNGSTINTAMDTFKISKITSGVISGDWTMYSSSQGGMGGMESGNTEKSEYSAKGIKSDNEININGGNITIKAYDDGIHASFGTVLENSETGLGNVNILGGNIIIDSKDDGIHADTNLTIAGGTINIVLAYEGIEGTYIYVNGGNTYIKATDDAVNSASLTSVSGGILDAQVGSGDVDCIDSNGNYVQSGGFVIAKCAATDQSGNMSSLDIDGSCTITGGTFINAGPIAATPSSQSTNNWVRFSNAKLSSGSYQIDGTSITFTLTSSISALWISSDNFEIGSSYTITGPTTLSWTQSNKAQTA